MLFKLIPLVVSLIAVIFGFLKLKRMGKMPVANKKILDAGKSIERGIQSHFKRDLTILGVATAVIFIIFLYLLGWKTALSFLIGTAVTATVSHACAILSAKSYANATDSERSSINRSINISLNTAKALSFLSIGAALLAAVAVYAIFKDATLLLALAFGGLLVAIISKLNTINSDETESSEEREALTAGIENNIVTSSAVGAVMGITAIAASYGVNVYPANTNIAYFPPLILVAGVAAMFIGSMFTNIKKSGGLFRIILPALIIPAVLLIAGSFFLSKWAIAGVGTASPLSVFIALAIGTAAPFILLLAGYVIDRSKLDTANSKLISNLVLSIVAVALILGAFHLADMFGIAIVSVGIISYLIPSLGGASALKSFAGTNAVALIAEIDTDTAEIKSASGLINKIKNNFDTYPQLIGIILIVSALFLILQNNLDLTAANPHDPYLISGILLGGLISYYFSAILKGSVKHGIIAPLSIILIVPTLLTIFLGLPLLLGLIIGITITSIIFALEIGDVSPVLFAFATTIAVALLISLAGIDYSVKAKMIIGIATIVLILAGVLVRRNTKARQ